MSACRRASIRVLVVDDVQSNRALLESLLQADGYTVETAVDGAQGVEAFVRFMPHLVLMDITMPVMDGMEATRRIKALAGEEFVPVIFITALSDEDIVTRCVQAGGDDFLNRPFQQVVLGAKVNALLRLRDAYAGELEQKRLLEEHQAHTEAEQRVAERLFANIAHTGCLGDDNIRYSISSMAIFNGDLLLAAKTPAGALHVMLGDFTGHGLLASIGALPASEIFYGMTSKGFGIGDIAVELNRKLKVILPTGMFLAANLLALDFKNASISTWSGGLPDLLIYRRGLGIVARCSSRHIPLGILDDEQFDRQLEMREIHAEDRLFLYTDGVTEARNVAGEMFGQQALEDLLEQNTHGHSQVEVVRGALAEFVDGQAQGDDITLMQIFCRPADATREGDAAPVDHRVLTPAHWRVEFDFEADALRHTDPLPLMIQSVMDIQGLFAHRERLYTVLAELFSNALDHGLLRLDSALKKTPEGFMDYYQQREDCLARLEHGRIRVGLAHQPGLDLGQLVLEVQDSGPGFDSTARGLSLTENQGHSGRGIALVRSLCKSLSYNRRGNRVRATYEWRV